MSRRAARVAARCLSLSIVVALTACRAKARPAPDADDLPPARPIRAALDLDARAPEPVALQRRRALLARLPHDPSAASPAALPGSVGPRWPYRYELEGLGPVFLWRANDAEWRLLLRAVDLSEVAPPGGLRSLGETDDGRWYRITEGPLGDAFLKRDERGELEIWSRAAACLHDGVAAAQLAAACPP